MHAGNMEALTDPRQLVDHEQPHGGSEQHHDICQRPLRCQRAQQQIKANQSNSNRKEAWPQEQPEKQEIDQRPEPAPQVRLNHGRQEERSS